MSVSEQGRNFALFFMIGLFIGFIFDIFREFRKNFKMPNLLVDLQDILFLLVAGWIYFRSVLIFNSGELRFYIVLSSLIGIVIYALTLSESCVIIIEVVFRLIKLTGKTIWRLLKIPYYFARKNFNKKRKIKECK
ncbi:MAG: spore cortex biosynthesis protein YabQ [Clostridia bacterium]|nr:spore cortex biosynthesis protein YabQ [Clostridia bacterium]